MYAFKLLNIYIHDKQNKFRKYAMTIRLVSHWTVSSVRILIVRKRMKVTAAIERGRNFPVPSPRYSRLGGPRELAHHAFAKDDFYSSAVRYQGCSLSLFVQRHGILTTRKCLSRLCNLDLSYGTSLAISAKIETAPKTIG